MFEQLKLFMHVLVMSELDVQENLFRSLDDYHRLTIRLRLCERIRASDSQLMKVMLMNHHARYELQGRCATHQWVNVVHH